MILFTYVFSCFHEPFFLFQEIFYNSLSSSPGLREIHRKEGLSTDIAYFTILRNELR